MALELGRFGGSPIQGARCPGRLNCTGIEGAWGDTRIPQAPLRALRWNKLIAAFDAALGEARSRPRQTRDETACGMHMHMHVFHAANREMGSGLHEFLPASQWEIRPWRSCNNALACPGLLCIRDGSCGRWQLVAADQRLAALASGESAAHARNLSMIIPSLMPVLSPSESI